MIHIIFYSEENYEFLVLENEMFKRDLFENIISQLANYKKKNLNNDVPEVL